MAYRRPTFDRADQARRFQLLKDWAETGFPPANGEDIRIQNIIYELALRVLDTSNDVDTIRAAGIALAARVKSLEDRLQAAGIP